MATSFPRAIHGTQKDVERNVVRLSQDWADDIRAGRPLRSLDRIDVAPPATLYCDEASDFVPTRPALRVYGLRGIRAEVCGVLDWKNRQQVSALIEKTLLGGAAGALWLNVGRPEPNAPAIVETRLAALFKYWSELRAFSYIDAQPQPQTLKQVIESHYALMLRMWADDSAVAPLEDRLRAAVAAAIAAPADESHRRIALALAQLATKEGRLGRPQRFADQAWLEDKLTTVSAEEYESAKTGTTLKRLLFALDRRD